MNYLPIYRTFTLSCNTFSGFNLRVDVAKFNHLNEVIEHVLTTLRNHLKQLGLESLLNQLTTLWSLYHIHDYDIETIWLEDKDYYICNHGCGK
jgi:hypothetical protein